MKNQLKGEAYIYSDQKRRFDVALARTLIPLEIVTRGLAVTLHPSTSSKPFFDQTRVGENGSTFGVHKLETLQADLKTPISGLHDWYRVHGVDELPQLRNILDGDMTVVGRRPIIPEELAEIYDQVGSDREGSLLVDRYKATVARSKPGLLSSFAIHSHIMSPSIPDPVTRLEMDIHDYENASHSHSVRVIRLGLRALVQGKLKSGSIPATNPVVGS